jgi:hypothetical protein
MHSYLLGCSFSVFTPRPASSAFAQSCCSTMSLTTIFPLNVAAILGFAVTPGTGKGYVSVTLASESTGLLEIDLETGAVVRGARMEEGDLLASPNGSILYLNFGQLEAIRAVVGRRRTDESPPARLLHPGGACGPIIQRFSGRSQTERFPASVSHSLSKPIVL